MGEGGIKLVSVGIEEVNDAKEIKKRYPFLFDVKGNIKGENITAIKQLLTNLEDLQLRLKDKKWTDVGPEEDRIIRLYFLAALAYSCSQIDIDEQTMMFSAFFYSTIGPGANANGFYVGLDHAKSITKLQLIGTILHELGHIYYLKGASLDPKQGVFYQYIKEIPDRAIAEFEADTFARGSLEALGKGNGFLGMNSTALIAAYKASLPEYSVASQGFIVPEGHHLARLQQNIIEDGLRAVLHIELDNELYSRMEAKILIKEGRKYSTIGGMSKDLLAKYLKEIGKGSLAQAFAKYSPDFRLYGLFLDVRQALEIAKKDASHAMSINVLPNGGIDLNALEARLQLKGTNNLLHLSLQDRENISIKSLTPIITGIENFLNFSSFFD